MSYVENNLMKDEEILYRGKIHWSFWIMPVIFSIITSPTIIIPIIILVFAALNYFGNEIALTNKRVIGKTGVVRRTSIDSKLDKIDSVVLDQGILARIFGSGTIVISTAGSKSPFSCLDKPNDFRNAVNEKVHA